MEQPPHADGVEECILGHPAGPEQEPSTAKRAGRRGDAFWSTPLQSDGDVGQHLLERPSGVLVVDRTAQQAEFEIAVADGRAAEAVAE
jgi:hypothetical protein